jgi:hypothetical protein
MSGSLAFCHTNLHLIANRKSQVIATKTETNPKSKMPAA